MEYFILRGLFKLLRGIFDTSSEGLSPSVKYLTTVLKMSAHPWNISYLRGIFEHLCGIFHTSVGCLTPSVERLTPTRNIEAHPWNISYLRGILNPPSMQYLTRAWNI